ncbi:glycine--tRNA ligase [[Eubacterium] cellulosolvens]
MKNIDKYDRVIELARRRGFFWPSYEIYGGVGGLLDFGPLGVAVKRKIENRWRSFFLKKHDFLEIETPVITPEKVFQASGHIEHFKDPMVECTKCKKKYRVDHLLSEIGVSNTESMSLIELDNQIKEKKVYCQDCGGELSKSNHVQTMFKTTIGPFTDNIGYGRPEAAQGIFVNFKRLHEVMREKFPIGIGQIGHALRNEISPRQGPVRLREFTIMEFEFFFDPNEPSCPRLSEIDQTEITLVPSTSRKPVSITVKKALEKKLILMEWMGYFMALSQQFISELGIPPDKQRFLEKSPSERAHYSDQTFDQEILLDRWGWTEVSGHAYRTSYDISRHIEFSGVDMSVFKPHLKPIEVQEKKLIPKVNVLRKDFGDDTNKILQLLKSEDAANVQAQINGKGSFHLGKYLIKKEHFDIKTSFKKETGRRIIPHVIEPSFGVDRLVYAAMEFAYSTKEDRVILSLPKSIVPFDAVVLPLMAKIELVDETKKIYTNLQKSGLEIHYDEVGSIGKRYARYDEIAVPLAVTIDYQTIDDGTVTIRDRDTWKQQRVNKDELIALIKNFKS